MPRDKCPFIRIGEVSMVRQHHFIVHNHIDPFILITVEEYKFKYSFTVRIKEYAEQMNNNATRNNLTNNASQSINENQNDHH